MFELDNFLMTTLFLNHLKYTVRPYTVRSVTTYSIFSVFRQHKRSATLDLKVLTMEL